MRIEIFFNKIQTRIFDEKTQQSVIYCLFLVWEFYFKVKYFPSIVFITNRSFKTLIECHLKKDKVVDWRWQAVIKNVNNLQSRSDMTDRSELPNYASQNNQG